MNGIIPQWLGAKGIQIAYGIGRDYLREITTMGYVRVSPLGNGKSENAKKLYCCEDVDKYLKYKAAGHEPIVMRGKRK